MTRLNSKVDLPYLSAAHRVISGCDTVSVSLVRPPGPNGRQLIGRYAAVPSYANPRVLVPLEATPAAMRTIMKHYSLAAASPFARAAAQALGYAGAIGIAPAFL